MNSASSPSARATVTAGAAKSGDGRILGFVVDFILTMAAARIFADITVNHGLDPHGANVVQLMAFEAKRPFQLRILAPLLIKLLVGMQLSLKDAELHFLTGSTAAAIWAFRAFLGYFFPARLAYAWSFALVFALLWNNCLIFAIWYPWDVPAIFFFSLGLCFILGKRWTHYYALLPLALLNRETAVFLTLAFLLLYPVRANPRAALAHFAAQVTIVLAIKGALSWAFRHNPGQNADLNLWLNIDTLRASFLSTNLPQTVLLFFSFSGCWLPAFLYYRRKPVTMQRLLWITAPFVGVMLVFGWIVEMRIYSELIPIFLASTLFTLQEIVPDDPPKLVRSL